MVGVTMPLEIICIENSDKTLVVGDRHLTIEEVVSVARHGVQVRITDAPDILGGVQVSCEYIQDAVESGQPIR